MIFPCMELFLVIFQVFRDFQSLWEPCFMYVLITNRDEENQMKNEGARVVPHYIVIF